MTRTQQNEHNQQVLQAYSLFKERNEKIIRSYRLRTCSAIVYETDNYWILQSYNTWIAIIDRNDGTLYDWLRYVYGFTATSAQHIAKFAKDYNAGMIYTYR